MNCLKCLLPLGAEPSCYGIHSKCFVKWFKVPSIAMFISLTRRSSTSDEKSIDIAPQNNSFFHGKFKKYSAVLDGQSFILKMRQPEAPELPEVEYLCNQIGTELGIRLAEYYIIDFEGDLVFVTKNFIHHTTPMDLQHFCHFRDVNQHNCKDLFSIIEKQTQRPHFVKELVKTILFDSLIGNHDRHGRNLGFLVMSTGTTLAPIYDNVSYLSLESGNMLKADFNPKGKIATGLSEEPSMRDYVLELRTLGFEDETNKFYKLTKRKMEKIELLIDQSFCSPLMKDAMKKLIEKRYMELKDEVQL